MPFTHQERKPGDLIRSDDWNTMGSEVERLDRAKVNRDGGDVLTGPLGLRGDVTVGAANQGATLRVLKRQEDARDIANHGALVLGNDSPGSASLRLGYGGTFSWLQGVGQQALSLNPSGGPVGVGTSAPRSTLSVAGSLAVGAGIAVSTAAPTNGLLVEGNVGIGAGATSGNKLHVEGSALVRTTLEVGGTLSLTPGTMRQGINLGGTDYGSGTQTNTHYLRSARNFAWYRGGAHHDGELNGGGGTLQMVLRNDNLGVGTPDPKSRLAVAGGATVGSAWAATVAAPADSLVVQGRLGVGVPAPEGIMDVGGDVVLGGTRGSRFLLHTRQNGAGDFLQITTDNAAGAWDYSSGVTLRRAGGSFGIGTPTPASKLTVAGGATVGAGYANTAAPANGLLVEGSLGLGTPTPRSALDTGKGVMTGAANDYAKAQYSLSGGGTIVWGGAGNRLKWTQRFIAMSMERGRTFSNGHVSIGQPGVDIPAQFVHDGNARSATAADGVVLHGWEALYAVHVVGSHENDVTYRIVRWDRGEFSAPSNWILVAVANPENNCVKLGTGQQLAPGTHAPGALPKLDTAEYAAAYVRAFDFLMGHSTRRGSPGRALVDLTDVLSINHDKDWPGGTRLYGRMEVQGRMEVTQDITAQSIELGPTQAGVGSGTPFIDFRFSNIVEDYNVRIINDANGRLSVHAPTFQVSGDLRLSGGALGAVGGTENLRTLRGVINSNGGIDAGTGFTATRVGVGLYDIRFSAGFSSRPAGVATQIYPGPNDFGVGANVLDNAVIVGIDTSRVRIKTGDAAGNASDRWFSFIVMGPR